MDDLKARVPNAAVLVGLLALGFGLLAAFLDGVPRSVALILLFVTSLALAVLASRPFAGQAMRGPLDGPNYVSPDAASTKAIHFVATFLYNLGAAVVVLALLVRMGVISIGFAAPLVKGFPMVLGAYVLLLAYAVRYRIKEQGGTYSTWYTRRHGVLVGLVSLPILTISVALLVAPVVYVGSLAVTERDLLVLILVGILFVGTQLFLNLRLPNVVDLLTQAVRAFAKPGDQQGTPPLVYVMVISFVLTTIIAWILLQVDVLGGLGARFADPRITFLILLLPVGLAIFFAVTTAAVLREARRGAYRQKMTTKLRNDLIVYGISTGLAILFGSLLAAAIAGRPGIGPFLFGEHAVMDLTVLTIVSTAGPIGIYVQREFRRINEIEERLADFLNDLADARRAGLPLATAVQNASRTDYGALSVEVDRMARQVAWGVSFNDALGRMGGRIRSSLVKRAVTLVIEASHTGGSVADILKAAARDAYEIKSLEADRKTAMTTYVIVMYVVFLVFLVVISILEIRFIPQVALAAEATASADVDAGFKLTAIEPATLRQIYFNAIMVQAMGNGIVGGIISEGRIMSGFRHVAIMAIAGWLVFRFALPGI